MIKNELWSLYDFVKPTVYFDDSAILQCKLVQDMLITEIEFIID